MTTRIIRIILTLMLSLCSGSFRATAESGTVFDDFNGPAGSPPNPALWDYQVGSGWGGDSGTLETETDSTNNVYLDGQGNLVIAALKSGDSYTSGRLVTRGKLAMTYGTTSARIELPTGQGIWPAFWMLGANIDTVGWPACGEIDIAEMYNVATHYHITAIGPSTQSPPPGGQVQAEGAIADLSQDFHTYWVTRLPGKITAGIDSATLATFTPTSLPPGGQWVFDNQPMYALFTVGVGGKMVGPPSDATPFPAKMVVDWFRYEPNG
jgi:beta-glucanase (GH16 family)